jgi:hypothetical protein
MRTSTHAALAILTACLVAAFVWWRLSAQRQRVERYWVAPLAGSAELYRVRATEWLTGHRRTAEVLGQLAARGREPGSAFEVALSSAFAVGDVQFVSIRDGDDLLRCTGIPLSRNCGPGSGQFLVPSARHPQARRVRPSADGHVLVPAAATIPAHGNSPGGVLVLWLDPETVLFPRLLRTRGSIGGARTYFVRRAGDSATVLAASSLGVPQPRRRMKVDELPPLIARPAADSELVIAVGPDGQRALAGHAYLPALRWWVYRALPEKTAYAPFRREATTEAILAFALGSFVLGLVVWTIRGQREQQVRAELLQARIESLQAQLRPHFMFNALNTIATLVHEDAELAGAMLLRLADLLRLSLEHSDNAEIPLRAELEILDAYIAVERVRFGANLRLVKDVAPDALDMPVPRWILQPLAENAIKHGAAYTRGEAALSVTARVADDVLELVVGDDGPSPPFGAPVQEGIGLRNTRTRLATLYGPDGSIQLRPRAGGGTEAVLRIPAQAGQAVMVSTTAEQIAAVSAATGRA